MPLTDTPTSPYQPDSLTYNYLFQHIKSFKLHSNTLALHPSYSLEQLDHRSTIVSLCTWPWMMVVVVRNRASTQEL